MTDSHSQTSCCHSHSHPHTECKGSLLVAKRLKFEEEPPTKTLQAKCEWCLPVQNYCLMLGCSWFLLGSSEWFLCGCLLTQIKRVQPQNLCEKVMIVLAQLINVNVTVSQHLTIHRHSNASLILQWIWDWWEMSSLTLSAVFPMESWTASPFQRSDFPVGHSVHRSHQSSVAGKIQRGKTYTESVSCRPS